ncbi:hypothetical protein HYDPIDRAFT_110430 [Hydnomerulius pinastri MD-312]|nr:hypothetical protein HYDPIDRAFT_110430 [Hydnomerulius pinastri MD-312]
MFTLPLIAPKPLTDFVSPSQGERERFTRQLTTFRNEAAALQARLAELNGYIQVTMHNLSLARVLPLDVLHEIFDHWAVRDDVALSTALRVCRRWREGILGYPQAWRKIELDPTEHCHERVAYWLGKSGSCALDVRVHLYSRWLHEQFYDLGPKRLLALRSAFAEVCKASIPRRSGSLTIFLPAYRHGGKGDVKDTIQSISDSLEESRNSLVPLFQNISFIYSGYTGFCPDGKLLGATHPNLQNFVCLGFPVQLEGVHAGATLRRIVIGRYEYTSAAELGELLSHLPVLQVLTLIDLDFNNNSDTRDSPYIHSSLIELNIIEYGSDCRDGAQLLFEDMLLTLPNLRRLRLAVGYCKGEEPEWYSPRAQRDALKSFLERSGASLEELHLPNSYLDEGELRTILYLAPRLQYLAVRIHECANLARELLTSFNSSTSDLILCPDLERLTLTSCSTEHVDLIRELANNRLLGERLRIRAFHLLHVYGDSGLEDSAHEIKKLLCPGTFRFSDEAEYRKWGEELHEAADRGISCKGWDPRVLGG